MAKAHLVFLKLLLSGKLVCLCVCLCMCLSPRLLITSGVMWTIYLYITAIVSIISRRGLRIEACHCNQPNKSKLVLYKLFLLC